MNGHESKPPIYRPATSLPKKRFDKNNGLAVIRLEYTVRTATPWPNPFVGFCSDQVSVAKSPRQMDWPGREWTSATEEVFPGAKFGINNTSHLHPRSQSRSNQRTKRVKGGENKFTPVGYLELVATPYSLQKENQTSRSQQPTGEIKKGEADQASWKEDTCGWWVPSIVPSPGKQHK